MSQTKQPIKMRTYSLAGTQFQSFERIVVSDHVNLPDVVADSDNSRIAYRAKRSFERGQFRLTLPWALLLIMITVAIIGVILLGKIQQGKALDEEFVQLQNHYTVSEKERLVLADRLNQAKDSNYICYYASQNLGMKLALHEETIQVFVPEVKQYQPFAGLFVSTASRNH